MPQMLGRRDLLLAGLGAALGGGARPHPGPKTLVVAPGGVGGAFASVQDAVDAVPAGRGDVERVVILLKPGVYKGPVVIANSKRDITFRGESAEDTVVTNDWSARSPRPDGTERGTSGSASVLIEGDSFIAENVTFANGAGRGRDVGQAVAIKVNADRAAFHGCRFLGWQDTLYANGPACRQYFRDCYVEGDVDFIFGSAAAVFERCRVHSKGPGYVTAQSRLTPEAIGGYVFRECDLTASADVPAGSVYLGRPWRDCARVVFIGCKLGAHVRPEGWHNWGKPEREKTSWYAEDGCTGSGADRSKRVAWAQTPDRAALAAFETRRFLAGPDGWSPPGAGK